MEDRMHVIAVSWERATLHLTLNSVPEDTKFFAVDRSTSDKVTFDCDENILSLSIPRTMVPHRVDWTFSYGEGLEPLSFSDEALLSLQDSSKVFPYKKGSHAYVVYFDTQEINETVTALMTCEYMNRNNKPHKERVFRESQSGQEAIKKSVAKAVTAICGGIYHTLNFVAPKNGKRVFFLTETKGELTGNLKAVKDRMEERGLDQEYQLSYFCCETLLASSPRVALNWLHLAITLARQDVIFVDDYVPFFKLIPPGKDTLLVQLWHAGVGFKLVGYARFGREDSPHPLLSCHRMYDYVVVGSRGLIPVYQEVFPLPKEQFLPLGLPRNDALLKEGKREAAQRRFSEKYPALKDKTCILFAPTYRGAGQEEAYYPQDALDFDLIYDACGKDKNFLIKMHPFARGTFSIPQKYQDRIIDVSEEEVNELLYLADALVTDYSSVIYEAALLNVPTVFFAFDRGEYEATRGFHWDFDRYAPGKICSTSEELAQALRQEDYETEKLDTFRAFAFDQFDGEASDRVIDTILKDKRKDKTS